MNSLTITQSLEQLNKSFGSLQGMKDWQHTLRKEIASGRPVLISQAGYGNSRYAYFNCKRWDADRGDYVCALEINGDLPRNWVKFLWTLANLS